MDNRPHSRASSTHSTANSHAPSTRFLLPPMSNTPFSRSPKNDFALLPPNSPDDRPLSTSLSVNYLPTKFSGNLVSKRKARGKDAADLMVPKQGGGRAAFKSNEARMPGNGDDDYDGVSSGWLGGKEGGSHSRGRWNRFKWILFVANTIFTVYSLAGFVGCLLIWFNIFEHADIMRVGNTPELIISTIACCLGILTSLIGWAGILLNNRSFLAVYCFLLWIVFALLVTPGYMTYKKRTFNLEGKINAQWSQVLGVDGRLRIQNQLKCCGYFNPFVEATSSQTCYARSVLPGCKGPYIEFEKPILERWYTVTFSIVPAQLFVMIAALLCSNHVTYRFGKGMMPKAYRLNMNSMAVIMDNYANQLAEQYGSDAASEAINRSRSNLQLDAMPTMPYSSNASTAGSTYGGSRYDPVDSKGAHSQ
ncbi:hypothetical protein BXZ70DRAFT_222530 [Cristinia sonorae]|uniref:Tetraspanin Tsp2 n=1 Tax=Cristinia sonorae TaxID=1940300 RepID=A0A8K0UPD2_9AGAR|nr:hypothetical protein BXZ70DRAFT_222530 [Cristinia sonorae]